MRTAAKNTLASLEFSITWRSEEAQHTERYYARKVNFWRDILPYEIGESLAGTEAGERIGLSFCGEQVLPYEHNQVYQVSREQFEIRYVNGHAVEPRFGRFYPQGMLLGVRAVFKSTTAPFRVLEVDPANLIVDLNPPFAGRDFELEIKVHSVREKRTEIGGQLNDWMSVITDGVGMQARWKNKPTDFFSDDPFLRADESDDAAFYVKPRLVTHVDAQALEHITSLYGQLLKPGMRVLDLMSGWGSHVPDSLKLGSLVGLGMNKEEMQNNPQLTSYVVHDINGEPRLPFDNGSFDAIICTVSVEYMMRPFAVFQDCGRILKPGGVFINTFSNRWFPPKVVRIWSELSEFERMGLVLEYYIQARLYDNLETYSMRGWPRPVTDHYYPKVSVSDPVYAVVGRSKRQ